MSAQSVGLAHYRARQQLANAITVAAARLWRQVDPADVSRSWLRLMPLLLSALTAAQRQAAAQAPGYVAEVLAAQGLAADVVDVVPESLAGIASDGRPLDTLLMQPALSTLAALGEGHSVETALQVGSSALQLIVSTQVADAGRVADGVAITGQRVKTGYVRMLVGKSCSRCVILAGKRYDWNAGFNRHPRCDCIHIPYREDLPDDISTDPMTYFRSLSRAEQDRTFGKTGTQAILDGADMNQVVNARKGIYVAGGRTFTREGTTARGLHGGYYINDAGKLVRRERVKISRAERKAGKKAPSQIRLMPEEIYRQAGGDRAKALSMLRDNGYITDPTLRRTILSRSQLRAQAFERRRELALTGDQARAAAPLSLLRQSDVRGGRALRPDEAFALSTYKGSGYSRVNPWLWSGRNTLRGDLAGDVRDIDAAMSRSLLTHDVVVHRGFIDPHLIFGSASQSNLTGAVWKNLAYVSSSTVESTARAFALLGADGEAGVMRILLPKGTGAIELSNGDYESELLAQRDLLMRVVSDTGPGTRPRVLDVEVLPQ